MMATHKSAGFFRAIFDRLLGAGAKGKSLDLQPRLAQSEASPAVDGGAEAEFKRALTLHLADKLDEAEVIYQAILRRQPDHALSLHNLGVVQARRENFEAAEILINQSIAIDPQKLSIGALSKQLPVRLVDCFMPRSASQRRTSALAYWLPLSEWKISPCAGLRTLWAMRKASSTSWHVMCPAIAQPMILRVNRSRTAQTYCQPSRVHR